MDFLEGIVIGLGFGMIIGVYCTKIFLEITREEDEEEEEE